MFSYRLIISLLHCITNAFGVQKTFPHCWRMKVTLVNGTFNLNRKKKERKKSVGNASSWTLTLPRSSSSWHLLRQSGLLVNSTRAFSAWCRTAVSVVSYSCLHRISSWARPWMETEEGTLLQEHTSVTSLGKRITPRYNGWLDVLARQDMAKFDVHHHLISLCHTGPILRCAMAQSFREWLLKRITANDVWFSPVTQKT